MPRIDFTQVRTAPMRAAQHQQDHLAADLAQAQAFLAQTDWQVIRAAEGAEPLPAALRAARQQARDTISALRQAQAGEGAQNPQA